MRGVCRQLAVACTRFAATGLLLASIIWSQDFSFGAAGAALPESIVHSDWVSWQNGRQQYWRDWERFEVEFLDLEPADQVRVFREGLHAKYVEDALVATGVDAVRYLVPIVRNSKEPIFHRWRAMRVLCDMDRFVPAEELPLPHPYVYIRPLNWGGQVSRYLPVTGRRIGQEGYETLLWAAEQDRDKELRFHARHLLGLLARDLNSLTLEEKVERWASAIHKNRGDYGGVHAPDEYIVATELRTQLIELAPDSLPLLIKVVETSSSKYVRDAVVGLLGEIDLYRLRLRSSPAGRQAIQIVKKTLEEGNLPTFRTNGIAEKEWERFSGQVLEDDWHTYPGSHLALLAEAFDAFYGEHISQRGAIPSLLSAPKEMKQFVTYLTEVDPSFPSWEYCHPYSSGEITHPRFKAKVARYYGEWKRFRNTAQAGSQ
jgi:hypothetical protein